MTKPTTIYTMVVSLLFVGAVMAVAVALQPPVPPLATRQSAAPMRQEIGATAPFRIEAGMLSTIQSLPDTLTDVLTASIKRRTEVIAATHTYKIPLEPFATPIEEIWCLTLYPSAPLTVYAQPYVAPSTPNPFSTRSFVPGRKDTYKIDRVLAANRGGVWELYHPEVYNWTALGC